MKQIQEIITTTGIQLLNEMSEVSPADLKKAVIENDNGIIDVFSRLLAEQKVLTLCKKWLSTTGTPAKSSKFSQSLLVGEPPPMTITIYGDRAKEFRYVRTDKATKEHAVQYHEIMLKNIADSQAKATDWEEKMIQLECAWKHNPKFTIAEALNWLSTHRITETA